MSEKRYFKTEYDEEWYLFDSTTISEQLVEEQAEYGYGVFANSLSPSEVVDLLNEQQNIIESEMDLFEKYKASAIRDMRDYSDKIIEMQKKVDEQQATIEQLQDLCGKSDGENAKLRIENKKLQEEIKLLKPTNIEQYEQIQKLQEENEQLRQEIIVYKKAFQQQVQRCTL